jgi:8-oxo-dGTP pyrophosphatase MutT (NUDIX family)
MHLTIYFGSKPLFLCTEITKEIDPFLHRDDAVFIDEFNSHTVKAMLYEMNLPNIKAGVFLHDNLDDLLKAFKRKFIFIQAAGGLVYTKEHELLLIFRRGKWDLPKGKLDEGELLETCAVREVKEETGLSNISLEKPLCISYHTYQQDGKSVLKESHWYLMKAANNEILVPQTEEDIEKCEWVNADKLAPYTENTHPSILDVLKEGVRVLGETKNI